MSYLHSPRLTFAGQFQADPSTVNNDPNHYNNATFQPNYQDYGRGATNGWWNPEGTGSWRFLGCVVTGVTYKDGTSTRDPKVDPVIGMSVMDSGDRVAGKIVDLDPQQQSVSMIWGLTVRLMNGEKCLLKGDFEPIAFNDIWWARQTLGPGAQTIPPSAAYQSVLHNLEWSGLPETNSRYLKELKETSPDLLSIKFNVDMFVMNRNAAQFTTGRMVGSIGPSNREEPNHFVIGRQLIPPLTMGGGVYLPTTTNIYMGCAIVDEANSQVVIDLGNSLTTGPDGSISESRTLTLAANKGARGYENLAAIDYTTPDWYVGSAGVATVKLTSEQLADALAFPLAITDGTQNSLADESAQYVRADQFVFRMNPGDIDDIDFYVSYLGKPLPRQTVLCQFSDSLIDIMGQGNGVPATATPNILTFEESSLTDETGKCTVKLHAGNPENPRGFIDGQVYALSYFVKGQTPTTYTIDLTTNPATILPASLAGVDPTNFISILVWDSVAPEIVASPTWADLQPVMQQYANLYPLMSKGIFNLAKKDVVDQNAEILKFVFSKDVHDPNYMPATRDLSADKKSMILNYLDSVLAAAGTSDTITTRKS